MNYLTAVRAATTRIRAASADSDEVDAQAALVLACLAFDRPRADEPAWTLLGMEVRDLLVDLYPTPAALILAAKAPSTGEPPVDAMVIELLKALADRYREVSSQSSLPARRRFAYGAAAACLDIGTRRLS